MFDRADYEVQTSCKNKINPIISTSPVTCIRIHEKLTFHLGWREKWNKTCSNVNRQAIFPQTIYNENIHISPENTSELMPYYDALHDH